MVVTIVCVCGEHNSVSERDLDTATCTRCGQVMLAPKRGIRPAARAAGS